MEHRLFAEEDVTTRKQVKLVQEGGCVAEVEVKIIESDEGWAPYLSLQDVRKLDAVRKALRDGDLAAAMKAARVFRLTPVTG
jgi:hypothetical protein